MGNKKALVVVDYQKDFINGKLPCGKFAENIRERIIERINKYLRENNTVIFTMDTHDPSKYEEVNEGSQFPPHCIKNTNGWLLDDSLQTYLTMKPKFEEQIVIIEKETFASVQLVNFLQTRNFEEVEFVGIATNVCVLHNFVFVNNFLPKVILTVDEECCASFDKFLHEQAINLMGSTANKIYTKEDRYKAEAVLDRLYRKKSKDPNFSLKALFDDYYEGTFYAVNNEKVPYPTKKEIVELLDEEDFELVKHYFLPPLCIDDYTCKDMEKEFSLYRFI